MLPDSPSGDAVPVPAPLMAPVLFPPHKAPCAVHSPDCIPPSLPPQGTSPLLCSCSAHHTPHRAKPATSLLLASQVVSEAWRVFLQGGDKISSAVKFKIAVPSIPYPTFAWYECRQTCMPTDKVGDTECLRRLKDPSSSFTGISLPCRPGFY